jgi:hypothetical protein
MAKMSNGTDLSLVAGVTLATDQYKFVKIAASGKAVLANATDLNQIGVVQNNPGADQTATVRVDGVSKVKAAGTIAAGAEVTSDANGAAVTATAGKRILGIAVLGGVAGDVISVLLNPRGTAV